MPLGKIRIDTEKHIYELDGNPLSRATKVIIELVGGELPKVVIEYPSEVHFDGTAEIEVAHADDA